jgi:hypothetical protein
MLRMRIRIWMLMGLVAQSAVALHSAPELFGARRSRYRFRAFRHQRCFLPIYYAHASGGWSPSQRRLAEEMARLSRERRAWHRAMAAKYRRAPRYPWLPVAPDIPMPN